MFGLFKGLWNSFFEKPTLKILIIGLDNAGKTALLNKLKSLAGQKCLTFDKLTPTVGLNIAKLEMGDCVSLFWDLGGQALLRTIWKKYYQECNGFIFVVDASDPKRFEEAAGVFREVLTHKDLGTVPFLILLNKEDKPEIEANFKGFEETFGLKTMKSLEEREFRVEKVSALQDSKLSECISWLNASALSYYLKSRQTA